MEKNAENEGVAPLTIVTPGSPFHPVSLIPPVQRGSRATRVSHASCGVDACTTPPLPLPPNRAEEEEIPIRKIHRSAERSKMLSTTNDSIEWREMRLSPLSEGVLLDKGVRFAEGEGRRREMMSPQGMANLMTADWLCMGYTNGWPLLPQAIPFPRLLACLESRDVDHG